MPASNSLGLRDRLQQCCDTRISIHSSFARSRSIAIALAIAALVSACDKTAPESGDAGPSAETATPSATPSVPVDQIAIAGDMFFKSADGTVKSWGRGSLFPDAAEEQRIKPTVVPDLAKTKQLAVGGGQTMCAVMMDGTVKCWGNGASGELGDGKENESAKPIVVPGVANAVAVAIGSYYVCALIGDGTVKCWGNNGFNQVSVEAKDKFVTPTAMPGVTGDQQIAAGNDTTCALGSDGSVKCWGLSCGADGPNLCKTPFTVASLAGATSIMGGWNGMCAVAKDSTAQCWGDNDVGQLGTGNTESSETGVITTVKGLTGVKELAAGQEHWCALMKDATVQCWGSNEYGQLGDGQTPEAEKFRATPAPVKGLADVVSLTCNSGACCAQVKDKSVKCWGENNSGVYFGEANSSNEIVTTPVAVSVN